MTSANFENASKLGRHKPLAACCCALFALAAPEAFASSTWTVTSCADHGAGTLRDIVNASTTLSSDTVDLSACTVSGISLTTGAIHITQDSLTLNGPDTGVATISGYYNGSIETDRIINHTGKGNLILDHLRISYGNISSSSTVTGGCVSSQGGVVLSYTQILDCTAHALTGGTALGGGVYAKGNLTAKYSQIAGNSATGDGFGGGVLVGGVFSASNSTINDNYANVEYGGVLANSASIASSTISGNRAGFDFGGLKVVGNGSSSYLVLSDSTISGNSAGSSFGGIFSSASKLTVRNSTVAFNTASSGKFSSVFYSPGLALGGNGSPGQAITISVESSILSNNTYADTEDDFSAFYVAGNSFAIVGSSNNIIREQLGPLRLSTTTTACPLLGPLRDNGGLTQTHALLSRSPAIDAGNNNSSLANDQRGPGYARQSGPQPDIGAYEVQQADIVFNTGFDDCPILE